MPATVPRRITTTRSLIASTSCRSDEIIRIATPWPARRSISRCMSALAPTSTPCVGSSRISTRGLVSSQRASATFCWLPPDSDETLASIDGGRMPRSLTIAVCRLALTAAADARPAVPRAASSDASVTFVRTGIVPITPWRRRSSGTYAMPCAIASRGVRSVTARAVDANLALVGRREAEQRCGRARSGRRRRGRRARRSPRRAR